jgi:hypothetical protein
MRQIRRTTQRVWELSHSGREFLSDKAPVVLHFMSGDLPDSPSDDDCIPRWALWATLLESWGYDALSSSQKGIEGKETKRKKNERTKIRVQI